MKIIPAMMVASCGECIYNRWSDYYGDYCWVAESTIEIDDDSIIHQDCPLEDCVIAEATK